MGTQTYHLQDDTIGGEIFVAESRVRQCQPPSGWEGVLCRLHTFVLACVPIRVTFLEGGGGGGGFRVPPRLGNFLIFGEGGLY